MPTKTMNTKATMVEYFLKVKHLIAVIAACLTLGLYAQNCNIKSH